MSLRWTKRNDWHVARFGETSLHDCERESEAINRFIETLPPGSKVAISFRDVEWVTSRVISLILMAKRSVHSRGGEFAITSPGAKVMEVLKITKLDRALTIRRGTAELN